MRKLWYFLFYGLCAFTIAFSLYWMAAVPPRQDGQPPAESPSRGTSSSPSLRAGAAVSGVEEEAEGYYLCDEAGGCRSTAATPPAPPAPCWNGPISTSTSCPKPTLSASNPATTSGAGRSWRPCWKIWGPERLTAPCR